jgi:hypothetical protein
MFAVLDANTGVARLFMRKKDVRHSDATLHGTQKLNRFLRFVFEA